MPRRCKYTPNVVKVYSPNATWSRVKAAVGGRLDRRSTWVTATAGRARIPTTRCTRPRTASGSTRRPGPATTTTSTTASPRRDARPRAGRRRHPQPPVLRLGQLRAGQRRADRHGRSPARRQLRGRLPEGRRRGGHRRRPRGAPRPTSGRCSRPTSRIEHLWRTQPNADRQLRVLRVEPGRPARRSTRTPITPTSGFYRSLAIGERRASRPTTSSWAASRRTDGDPASLPSRATPRSGPTGAALFSGVDDGRRAGRQTLAAGTRLRVVEQAVSTTADGTTSRSSQVAGRRRPDDHGFVARRRPRSPGTAPPPAVRSLTVGTAVLAQRRRAVRHGDPARALHRVGRLEADGQRRRVARSCSTASGTGSTLQRHLERHWSAARRSRTAVRRHRHRR